MSLSSAPHIHIYIYIHARLSGSFDRHLCTVPQSVRGGHFRMLTPSQSYAVPVVPVAINRAYQRFIGKSHADKSSSAFHVGRQALPLAGDAAGQGVMC